MDLVIELLIRSDNQLYNCLNRINKRNFSYLIKKLGTLSVKKEKWVYIYINGEISRITHELGFYKTYKNGLLHSYGDEPSYSCYGVMMWHEQGVLREGDIYSYNKIALEDGMTYYYSNKLRVSHNLPVKAKFSNDSRTLISVEFENYIIKKITLSDYEAIIETKNGSFYVDWWDGSEITVPLNINIRDKIKLINVLSNYRSMEMDELIKHFYLDKSYK